MREGALGDFITLKRGYDLPLRDRVEGDVPIISSSGPTGMHNVAKVAGPGVVTGRYGTLGEVFYSERPYWPLNTALYVKDFQGNIPRFIYYFMHTLGLGQRNAAGAVPGVNRNVLHQMPVRVPALPVQRRIADILSAYDDLIENNNRRMDLLEESIHLLYREWFVYLRFPGHERTKIVDGVPEGWRRAKASDSFVVQSGGTPKTRVAEFWNGSIPFFTPKDAPSGVYVHDTEKTLSESGLRHCNSKLYPPDSLFITARGTVGKLALAQRAMAMNQSCYRLKPIPPFGTHFLYPAMAQVVRHLKAAAVGGVFATIIIKTFDHVPMMLPNGAAIEAFESAVGPVYKQLQTLADQTRKLREARDLLLPRLMDGRIPV